MYFDTPCRGQDPPDDHPCIHTLPKQQEKAHEPSQRYKEGKFILERVRLFHEAEDGEGGAHNEGWLSL